MLSDYTYLKYWPIPYLLTVSLTKVLILQLLVILMINQYLHLFCIYYMLQGFVSIVLGINAQKSTISFLVS